MTATTDLTALPRISDIPPAAARPTHVDRDKEWSEIEAMLASPAPLHESTRNPSGRASVLFSRTFIVASVAFASLLAGTFWLTREGCGVHASCLSQTTTADAGMQLVLRQGRSVGLTEPHRH